MKCIKIKMGEGALEQLQKLFPNEKLNHIWGRTI